MGNSWKIPNPGNRTYFKKPALDVSCFADRDLSEPEYFGGGHIVTLHIPLCGEIGGRFLVKLNQINKLFGRKKEDKIKTLMDLVLSYEVDMMPKRITKEDTEVEVI